MNESIAKSENASDKEAISELIYAWVYHRNRGNWDELRDTFWPEGTISISWFDGHFEQFVASLKEMSEKGNPTKHIAAQPFIKINGNRAVSESDCTLFVRGGAGRLEIDLTAYLRFYDLLEKRERGWRILKRTAIYEKDRTDCVRPSLLFWIANLFINLKKYPRACRHTAFALEKAGYAATKNIVEDPSEELNLLYKESDEWLSG
jgi:hypothetical protein